ncbi:gliding motility-associated C-terminal domain-containing protein [Maribellus maritimus]|uniref:gliding motility-associated C-terminal domain-containing protein n=1 Tax=Maribellus maritimus TaxID=2870838 RepID=UPI001EEB4A78|nr:gliding motility-associated C-terminal domain-containing protein [Maribellus maritimus]MCG6191087.1 gliding motility-associated C-terminal domain-containing protein [Maribellus maritimus]
MKKIIIINFCIIFLFISKLYAADSADPDTWTVVPNQYQYSMTVTSVLVFGTEESRDMNDKIAAFVGTECRGVAKPITYLPSDDRYIANLLIYSNETSGEEVTIYMYDDSEDKVIKVAEKLQFSANATFGRPNDPYFSLTTYNLKLYINADGYLVENADVELGGYGTINTTDQGIVTFYAVEPSDSLLVSVTTADYDFYIDTFAVVDKNVTETIELTLTRNYVVTGLDNAPLDSAKIELENHGSVLTNEEGIARFSGIRPNSRLNYSVSYDKYDVLFGADLIEAPTNQNKDLQLIFTTHDVNFIITDNGTPVANAEVTLSGYGSVLTNAVGVAHFGEILPVDSLAYTIDAANFDVFSGSVDVNNDINLPIDLTLTTFKVTINLMNGELPVENAEVVLDGYGFQKTDVYGNVIFPQVLINDQINYSVSADGYNQTGGSIAVVDQDVNKKVSLKYTTYSATFNVSDGENPVAGSNIVLTLPASPVVEDFDNSMMPDYLNTSGNNSWNVDTSEVFMGIYSLCSGKIYDNQSSEVQFQKTVKPGIFSFFAKVSAEESYDYLVFYIDGEEKERWSGETEWFYADYLLEEGTHTFKWSYKKDGSNTEGKDCVWVDYIKFPSASMNQVAKTTDVAGRAVFNGLMPGKGQLEYTVSNNNYNPASGYVNIVDRNVVENIDLNVHLVFKINKEFDGEFLETDSVYLKNYGKMQINQQGIASFNNVIPANTLEYKIQCNGYDELTGNVEAVVNDTIDALLQLTRYNVSFQLSYKSEPLAGMAIDLEGYETQYSDNDGIVKIENVIPGSINYRIDHADYLQTEGTVELTTENVLVSLEIVPVFNVSFQIKSDAESGSVPISNASVYLIELEREAISDENGIAVFDEMVPAESIRYSVEAEGYNGTTGNFSVNNEDATENAILSLIYELKATNLVTPNGDGKNDYWEIYNQERYAHFIVRIFSPKGEKLFETDNYTNNKWDGKYNGNSLPVGIYYYIISTPDNSAVFKGIINLIY